MNSLYKKSYILVLFYFIYNFFYTLFLNLGFEISDYFNVLINYSFIIIFIFVVFHKYKNRSNIFILSTLFLYFIVFLIRHGTSLCTFNNCLIILLPLSFLVFLCNLYINEGNKIPRNLVTFNLLLYLLLFIFLWIFKYNFILPNKLPTHFDSFVTLISTISSITIPYLFINLEKKVNITEVITIFLSIFVSIIASTKLPLIIFTLCVLYKLIKNIIVDIRNRKISYSNNIILISFIVIFIFKFKKTPLYKNLINRFKFLNIGHYSMIFTSYKLLDSVFFNQRIHNIVTSLNAFTHKTIDQLIFGLNKPIKYVKSDVFDILFSNGFLGLIIFLIIFILLLNKIKNKLRINYLPIVLVVLISILSGNLFINNLSSLLAVIILSNNLFERKEERILFTIGEIKNNKEFNNIKTFISKTSKNKNAKIVIYSNYFNYEVESFGKTFELVLYKNSSKPFINYLKRMKFIVFNFKEYNESYCLDAENENLNFITRHSSNKSHIYLEKDYIKEVYINNLKSLNEFLKTIKLDKFNYIILNDEDSKTNLLSLYPRFADKIILKDN